jgi:hypothetical protein
MSALEIVPVISTDAPEEHESDTSSESLVKNELIYFDLNSKKPPIFSMADFAESNPDDMEVENDEDEEDPETTTNHHFPELLRNIMARVEQYSGNLGVQDRSVPKPQKKIRKDESEDSSDDSNLDENLYDLDDPFINDADLDLGTDQAYNEVLEEGFYVLTDAALLKRFPELLPTHDDQNQNAKSRSPRKSNPKTPKDFERYLTMFKEVCEARTIDKVKYNKLLSSIARKMLQVDN